MTEKYITWTYSEEDKSPEEGIVKLWPNVGFTHTPYEGQGDDVRHLAIGSYGNLSDAAWERFKNNFSAYAFYETTPGSAVALCNEWYSPDVGSEFTLDGDGFTIVDNR